MSLCPPLRCPCAITSGSLAIQGLTGGGGYNIETYEGLATEVPDTRPTGSNRFDGMRVFTTDTKRLWRWDNAGGVWRIMTEPVQKGLVAADFTILQPASVTKTLDYSAYQRSEGQFWLTAHFTITGTGTGGNVILVSIPSFLTMDNLRAARGDGLWFDSSASFVHLMLIGGNLVDRLAFYASDDGSGGPAGVNGLANGDTFQFNLHGVLA